MTGNADETVVVAVAVDIEGPDHHRDNHGVHRRPHFYHSNSQAVLVSPQVVAYAAMRHESQPRWLPLLHAAVTPMRMAVVAAVVMPVVLDYAVEISHDEPPMRGVSLMAYHCYCSMMMMTQMAVMTMMGLTIVMMTMMPWLGLLLMLSLYLQSPLHQSRQALYQTIQHNMGDQRTRPIASNITYLNGAIRYKQCILEELRIDNNRCTRFGIILNTRLFT